MNRMRPHSIAYDRIKSHARILAMAEVKYTPDDYGWFPVSRRFVGSSRWSLSDPTTIKVMIYLLERASNPMNPYPGDVREGMTQIGFGACINPEECETALKDLLNPDVESQSGKSNGAFLEELTCDLRVVGYRILNFQEYNPAAVERGAAKLAERRSNAGRKAALARWSKDQQE